MEAGIRVDGELLEKIEVNNGLRQGCTMAPTLFNLYAGMVTEVDKSIAGCGSGIALQARPTAV